jgi:hypothetical protein
MLHAERLEINHPRTGMRMEFRAPLPEDIRKLLEYLSTKGRCSGAIKD